MLALNGSMQNIGNCRSAAIASFIFNNILPVVNMVCSLLVLPTINTLKSVVKDNRFLWMLPNIQENIIVIYNLFLYFNNINNY
jgi:hypothetical protein